MGDSEIVDDAETQRRPHMLLGRYQIERIMGGGLATVFIVRDTQFARRAALKTIKRSRTDDPDSYRELRERFAREKEAHERIGNHPNLVTVYDFVIDRDDDDTPYLILEYVPGGSLDARIADGPLDVADAVRLTADIARGLAVAHAEEVVHRDIKPANIFLAADGRAQVGDFGIAQVGTLSGRSRATESHPGTPLYMSPEQGGTTGYVRPESDQYSVGLVLFEMLAGTPYRTLRGKAIAAHLATMPPEVRALFQRMTAENPDERYESMQAVLAAIEGGRVRPDAPVRRRLPGRGGTLDRRAFLVGAAGLLAAGGGVAGIAAFRHGSGEAIPTTTPPTATAVVSPSPSAIAAATALPTATAPRAPAVTTPPTVVASPATTAWAEPRGLMVLRYPRQWSLDPSGIAPPAVLHLRGPDDVEFVATITDPQQGGVADEIEIIRRNQARDTTRLFSDMRVSSATISDESAQMLSFRYTSSSDPSGTSTGIWWVVNHEGKEFTFVATAIGAHRAEVDAIMGSVNLTNAWTDSLGRISLQYPNGWRLMQNQSKENALELRGPDSVALFVLIYSPPGGTPDGEILTALNFHKNDAKFLYKDGPTSDVRIGEEAGKTFSYIAIARSDPTAAASDNAIWEVNHKENEFQFVAGNIGAHRTEIDAIIASVTFLR